MKPYISLKRQATLLLVGELLLLFSSALWEYVDMGGRWPVWLHLILFSAGGYALAGSKKWLFAYIASSLLAVLLASIPTENPVTEIASCLLFAVAFALLFRVIVVHCFFREEVDSADRLIGGIAGYLLLGFLWASQAPWASVVQDYGFLNTRTGEPVQGAELLYFNFVTLTTLGYGDIIPVNAVARLLVILNSTTGVLYIAIFVSALVAGMRKR